MSDVNLQNPPPPNLENDPTKAPPPNPDPFLTPPPPSGTDSKTEDQSLLNKEGKKEDTKAEGAPEAYEPFKAPEGYEYNAETAKDFLEWGKKNNLSQSAMQELVDTYGKTVIAADKEPFEAYRTMRAGWVKEVVGDAVIGNGKDDIKPEVRKGISDIISQMGDAKAQQAFKEAMDLTGAGDHPAFVRGLFALAGVLAKDISEGKHVAGNPPAPPKTPQSAGAALWPNLPSANSQS